MWNEVGPRPGARVEDVDEDDLGEFNKELSGG